MKYGLLRERKNCRLAHPPSGMRGFLEEFEVRVKDFNWFKKESIFED